MSVIAKMGEKCACFQQSRSPFWLIKKKRQPPWLYPNFCYPQGSTFDSLIYLFLSIVTFIFLNNVLLLLSLDILTWDFIHLLGVGVCPSKRYWSPNPKDPWMWPCLEVGSLQDDQVKMRSLEQALIQYDCYPHERGKFRPRHRHAHGENTVGRLKLCCHKPRKYQKLGKKPGTALPLVSSWKEHGPADTSISDF